MNPTQGSDLYIGLMSGTSLDGVDCALADFSASPKLLATRYLPYPADLRDALLGLCESGHDEIDRAGELGVRLSDLYADAVTGLLAERQLPAQSIRAIGCHGQTVRHRPERGYTVQLVNPARLTERTGITVVADFRSRDVAAGGHGAPLVPAFHAACFRSSSVHRVILNIGGIANITDLPPAGLVRGFDTGPGNVLMDTWVARQMGKTYDADGRFAAAGSVVAALLEAMLADDYLHRPPPKSTGRERYNAKWLERQGIDHLAAADVQATLAEFTARSIAGAIGQHCGGATEVYVCGGGAHNGDLMRRLQSAMPERRIATTDSLGVASDWVEAMAFAWLAHQTIVGAPGNLPEVTGANGPRILGAIYSA